MLALGGQRLQRESFRTLYLQRVLSAVAEENLLGCTKVN